MEALVLDDYMKNLNKLSPFQLLDFVEKTGMEKTPGIIIENKIPEYLKSTNWKIRNIAVKLIGMAKLDNYYNSLLEIVSNREPASFWQQICGGDYYQVGFIRRNALRSFSQLKTFTPELEKVLLLAFKDPYFEVRTQACLTIADLSSQINDPVRLVKGLTLLLKDRCFETLAASILALGKIADSDDILPFFNRFVKYGNWKVRQALVNALINLYDRKVCTKVETLNTILDSMVITSTDFKPEFQLKKSLHLLAKKVAENGHK